jgi:hypothetical protein
MNAARSQECWGRGGGSEELDTRSQDVRAVGAGDGHKLETMGVLVKQPVDHSVAQGLRSRNNFCLRDLLHVAKRYRFVRVNSDIPASRAYGN